MSLCLRKHYIVESFPILEYHQILDSLVVRIPACHAGGRGSIPRQGENLFWKKT